MGARREGGGVGAWGGGVTGGWVGGCGGMGWSVRAAVWGGGRDGVVLGGAGVADGGGVGAGFGG
ncbi:hypothetical protein HGQ98_35090 [Achromobacter ruhlandii]|uniref:Uncharacterized protein n=1 Tax=Achromobacter ruhlandii TaxID=72557 RepID=A0A848NXR5_9BURK|nr:hypothetical protein [Achromobacter ruhlandii]